MSMLTRKGTYIKRHRASGSFSNKRLSRRSNVSSTSSADGSSFRLKHKDSSVSFCTAKDGDNKGGQEKSAVVVGPVVVL